MQSFLEAIKGFLFLCICILKRFHAIVVGLFHKHLVKIHVHKNKYARKERIAPHCATSRQQQPFGKSINNVFGGSMNNGFFFQLSKTWIQTTSFGGPLNQAKWTRKIFLLVCYFYFFYRLTPQFSSLKLQNQLGLQCYYIQFLMIMKCKN